MKILVGNFTTESNSATPYKTTIKDYDIEFGQSVLDVMNVEDVFLKEDATPIPLVYLNANAASVIDKKTFLFLESLLLDKIKEHLKETDGIYLHLHGASYVDEIGSGDFHILKEIRKIVGPYMPIAVSCDPHGNLNKEYAEATTIIRSYRESPHVDALDTKIHTIKLLCQIIRTHQSVHSIYRKLPLILGGEQSVSLDEPVFTINKYMDEMEKDSRILSASFHVGYLRHDCSEAGCGVIVVPATINDIEYCETKADELAKFVWDLRHEFHYTGLTASKEEALKMALEFKGKPFVITDSGDNTTSGATGWNTFVLRQFLQIKDLSKTVLFGSIRHEESYKKLEAIDENEIITIDLGQNYDELSKSVSLKVQKKATAPIYIQHGEKLVGYKGKGILVHVVDTTIDIIVANLTARVTNEIQFEAFNIDWKDYDILVLKQGYIFPDFKKHAKGYVMSLTDGNTPQDTKHIPFKLIQRPMYPIDEI